MRALPADALAALRAAGVELVTDGALLERFGHDETEGFRFPPAAAALPASTAQIQATLRVASRHRIPVAPRGAGTGLSGGALPVAGGLVLGLERMNRIRGLDRRNATIDVEAGVTVAAVDAAANEAGLFYPPDPASRESCQIGGNIAEDSAGPRSCKYGTTRRFVLGLEAVLADGSLLRTGGANRKDVAGYNLTQLLVGSEGTLAVVAAATLRLLPVPRERLTLVLPFPALESAASAVEEIFATGNEPAACEILDHAALAAVGGTLELPPALAGAGAALFLELDGEDPDALLRGAERIAAVAERCDGGEVLVAQDPADQRRLWRIRRGVAEAVKHRSVYKEADTVVPRARLADLVRAAHDVAAAHGLEAACYGHAADGNLHVNLLRGALPPDEWEARRDAAELDLFERVVALGGSVTGEHGVGWTQRRFLPLVASGASLRVQRALKAAFDPAGILNPGKVFTDEADG
jgi:glycolate oxidase